MTTSPTVTIVAETHSSRLGQVTRFNSDAIARICCWRASSRASVALSFFGASLLSALSDTLSPGIIVRFTSSLVRRLYVGRARSTKFWQGGQDSNLQPTVLETATLPIELPPSIRRAALGVLHRPASSGLPRFLVRLVALAPLAVFLDLQSRGGLLPVLHRRVVAAFAVAACQRDDDPVFLFGHYSST